MLPHLLFKANMWREPVHVLFPLLLCLEEAVFGTESDEILDLVKQLFRKFMVQAFIGADIGDLMFLEGNTGHLLGCLLFLDAMIGFSNYDTL
jgi:hypothetical protein